MSSITFESVPSGANFEIVATDFITDCLSGGCVTCEWNTLKYYLENLTVSDLWWSLTRDERYSIAVKAIENTIPGTRRIRTGHTGCVGGTGDWECGMCVQNANIRYLAFASTPSRQFTDVTALYYECRGVGAGECCYTPDKPYHLPCHIVWHSCGHAMCGVQIVNNFDSLDNWVVFQYSECDIKPGNTQMRYDGTVTMRVPSNIYKAAYLSSTVATFTI